jgi:nitroimidazol reductase NimA-like FMN-containing flavoprotein (pyridoxamine 5'-phosphate oxidase superfamily)
MEPNGQSAPPAPPREQLAAAECLRLLASVPVGRIVYTQRAMPAVELVNFALDGGDIVIRTDPGSTLAAATHDTVVAFEADEVDTATGQGWSVMAVGRSREVTESDDIARLRDIGLRSLEPGGQEHFIRVTPGILSGRRLAGEAATVSRSVPATPAGFQD